MLAAGVRWHDDWYAIEEIADGVFAIGEPRYHQINWNYLICGLERALLLDTGPGLRDIAPVARSLTSLPLIAMPSHLHFDHTGNLHRFAEIAMADLPILRACIGQDGLFRAPERLYLGSLEDMMWKPVSIAHWWPPGRMVDLGGLSLEVVRRLGIRRIRSPFTTAAPISSSRPIFCIWEISMPRSQAHRFRNIWRRPSASAGSFHPTFSFSVPTASLTRTASMPLPVWGLRMSRIWLLR
jgi:hypothetical protein